MSIQNLDLTYSARESNAIANVPGDDYQILLSGIVQLLGRLKDMSASEVIDESRIEEQRSQKIRELRAEFGFAPDDEPVAHLRPFGAIAAA